MKLLTAENIRFLEILTYQFSFSQIFGMEKGIKMIFVSKGFLIPVEYIELKLLAPWRHQPHLLVLGHIYISHLVIKGTLLGAL